MRTRLSEGRQWYRRASRRLGVGLALAVALLVGAPAHAQNGFDVQRFNPSVSRFTGFFTQPYGRVLESGRWEMGLIINYANDPLVLVDANDERIASPVSDQLTANLLFAVGIADIFDIGVDIPVILYQNGDAVPEAPDAESTDAGFGIGDIRLVPRFMMVRPDDLSGREGFALGLLLDMRLPTGKDADFQGEGFRIEPKLALDFGWASGVSLGATLGFLVRTADTVIENVEASNGLTWSVAFAFPLSAVLQLVPELYGQWLVSADDVDTEEIPVEGLLGFKWFISPSVLLDFGAGAGLVRGAGAPDYRVFLGVAYSPERKSDRDGDGYFDDEDGCPDAPEDFDDFEDADGCPDPDNDQDGIFDIDDSCPMEPEDYDGFEDVDGCPDPDNDQDGILDVDDLCPMEPEDPDGFQDEDGCPDPDNDQDGILDVDDECPNRPETFNDVDDEDGCPDRVTVTCTAIEISEKVHFDTDSDVIQSRSFDLLNEVAEVFGESPWIRQVRIEGHTDSRGPDAYNLDLSQRRAASVLRYLVDRGVDPEKLEAEGFGESRPIADNATEEGRADNRRVEFNITEQEGCPEQPVEQ